MTIDASISPVQLHDTWLRVRLPGGHADFHYRWLRHNSDGDRHPKTGERTLCSSELPDDLRALEAYFEGDALAVRWSDGLGTTRYSLAWLAEEAYARNRSEVPPPPGDVSAFTFDAPASLDALVRETVSRVQRDGAAIVKGNRGALAGKAEDLTEPLIKTFEAQGLTIVETHFGRIEDLRPDNTTNKNTDQLGYTNASIELHTDQPFIDFPPRYQILQAIKPAADGGDNFLVDGLAAARYLGSIEDRDLELLTTVPVRFHRKQKSFTSLVVAPLLAVEGPIEAPSSFQVRYSYFTMAPHQVPFPRMQAWYRAYDRFARLVRDPRHQLRAKLETGDFLIYDNHRMMHARTGFSGSRWLRGIYLNPAGYPPAGSARAHTQEQ